MTESLEAVHASRLSDHAAFRSRGSPGRAAFPVALVRCRWVPGPSLLPPVLVVLVGLLALGLLGGPGLGGGGLLGLGRGGLGLGGRNRRLLRGRRQLGVAAHRRRHAADELAEL